MPYTYRVETVRFVGGATVALPDLTVVVGANNSGKSQFLKDVVACTCTEARRSVVLADALSTRPGSLRELTDRYGLATFRTENGDNTLRFLRPTLDGESSHGFGRAVWPDAIAAGTPSREQLSVYCGAALTAFLTTGNRLRLIERCDMTRGTRNNLLHALYHSPKATETLIRDALRAAFPGRELALDFSDAPGIEFRVGHDFSSLPPDPREARPVLQESERLDEQGDGIRSFAGIVTAMLCGERPVFIIDEPETFLHPPQAYRIGEFVAQMAGPDRQVIVATHSADVLRGLVAAGRQITIIRLDRTEGATRHTVLPAADIAALYSDPLVSSRAVIDGLFFSGAVVTEADGDARFYAAIAERLPGRRDIHWVNADNKQTVARVLQAYRKLGVRCAVIVDIDVLNDATEFAALLDALGLSAAERAIAVAARGRIEAEVRATPIGELLRESSARLATAKALVESALAEDDARQMEAVRALRRTAGEIREKATAWHMLKSRGRAALAETGLAFEEIDRLLRAQGVFINPAGELEASLGADLPWRPDKRGWFRDAMPLVRSLTVAPDRGPWRFVGSVLEHLRSPPP